MPILGSYILALQSMYSTYLSFQAMKVWKSSGGAGEVVCAWNVWVVIEA